MIKHLFSSVSKFFLFVFASFFFLAGCENQPAPDDILTRAKEVMVSTDSGRLAMSLGLNGEGGESTMEIQANVTAVFSRVESIENRVFDLGVDVMGELKSAERDLMLEVGFDWIANGLQNYLKINTFSTNDDTLQLYLPIVNLYKGKWVFLSEDFIPPELALLPFDEEDDVKVQQRNDLFIGSTLFDVREDHGTKRISGQEVYHLGLTPNQEGLKEFYRGVAGINGVTLSESELQDLVSSADQFDQIEVYIGVDDFRLYKAEFMILSAVESAGVTTRFELLVVVEGSDYDVALEVQIPDNAQEVNPFSLPESLELDTMTPPDTEVDPVLEEPPVVDSQSIGSNDAEPVDTPKEESDGEV